MTRSVLMASLGTLFVLASFPWGATALGAGQRVGIVVDVGVEGCAEYGLASLAAALRKQDVSVQRLAQPAPAQVDFLIVAGVTSKPGLAAQILKGLNVALPEGPEALVVRRTAAEGKPAFILCGSDARGLMYAALDAADRVAWSGGTGDPLARIRDTSEKPYVLERAVSIYTMQRAYFESRLYDETYWQRYFAMLARSRMK